MTVSLADIPIFKFLEAKDLQKFSMYSQTIDKQKGEIIIMAGEEVEGFYVIMSGEVSVFLSKPIGWLSIGDSFGEMSLVENTTASATITADSEQVKLLFFHRHIVQEVVEKDPRLASAFFKGIAVVLSNKLRNTTHSYVSSGSET
jgi:CRP-like cAMP-binding protein